MDRILRLPVSRPRWTAAVCILLILVCALGASRLSINADTRVFFSDANTNRQQLTAFEARFEPSVNLLIVFHAEQGSALSPARLAVLARATEAAWRLPYSTRVDSPTNAVHLTSDDSGLSVADMFNPRTDDPVAAAARIAADPLLVGRLVAADGRTAAINVTFSYPLASSAITGEILAAAQAMVAASGAEAEGLAVWYGGRVASSNAFSTASKTDLKTLLPAGFAVILVLLMVLTRSVRGSLALFFTAFAAAATTMGIGGYAGLQVNAATAHVPTVIIALGVAALAHVLMAARRHRADGVACDQAVARALAHNWRPVALTFGTTSVGFASLMMADAPPFRDLGLFIAVGSLVCLAFGLSLLPALLILFRLPPGTSQPVIMSLVQRLGDFVVARRQALLIGVPALAAVSAAGLSFVHINDRFPSYFSTSFDFRVHADLIEQNLTGLEVIEFDVGGPGPGAVHDPAYLDGLARFETWLRMQPRVVHVTSVLDIFERLHLHLAGEEAARAGLPRSPEQLAQYLLLYELSLPPGLSLTNQITVDKARSRVTVILDGATTREVREFRERADLWLAGPEATGLNGHGTGLAVMFAYLSSLNVSAMIGGTALALVIISGILVGAFRHAGYGLASLVPNLLPGAVAFGIWGYMVGEVGVAVSVVGALALGIIVDDTIHLIWRYREARQQGATPEAAVRFMFAKVSEPMIVSTLVLVAGFAVLGLSGFHITSSTGILTAGTIASALIFDVLLLPSLLMAMDRAGAWLRDAAPWRAVAGVPPEGRVLLTALRRGDDAAFERSLAAVSALGRGAVPVLIAVIEADLSRRPRPDERGRPALVSALAASRDPRALRFLDEIGALPSGRPVSA